MNVFVACTWNQQRGRPHARKPETDAAFLVQRSRIGRREVGVVVADNSGRRGQAAG